MHYDVIVIGGGSAGLMAAISAAETGAKTLLLEKGKKLGTKLLISGGGRCNVTNRLPEDEVLKNIPGNGKFLYSAFSIFNNYDIIDYFESMGVALKEEDHGRMFPVSNSAKSVVDTLVQKMEALQVDIRLSSPVQALDYAEDIHTVILENDEKITAKAIVIAVGGKSVPHTGSTGDGYAWAKKAGHTITDLYPTEVALTSSDTVIKEKALQGLSLRDVAVTVLNKKGKSMVTHQMDMVFTHFGVSGPAILRCSQFVVKELMYQKQQQVRLAIDLVPEVHQEKLYETLLAAMEDQALKSFKNIVKSILDVPERLLVHILTNLDIAEDMRATNISKEKTRQFVNLVKGFIIHTDGSLSIQKAFVTGGGVATKEIVPSTMASKLMENLFFCGEILDIHGYTGGYNITAAFVTGRLAGTNAAYASMA